MDIIDIILARAKSFTGETATLVRQAQAAMSDANDIVDRLEEIENRASAAAETAEGAAEALAGIDETVDAEIKKLSLSIDSHGMANGGGVTYDLITTYPDNTTVTVNDIVRMYNSRGGHVNGTMTQEAINHELGLIEESLGNFTVNVNDNNTSAAKIKQLSVTKNGQTTTYNVEKNYTSYGDNEDGSMTQKAIKAYVTNTISNATISGGGGSSNLGSENAGAVVVVGEDGQIISSSATEQSLIEALIRSGVYTAKNALGLNIDYENKSIGRTQEATNSTNFSTYSMYGGRMRCNVADDGTITAFYGDNNYKEDGSNGQVMVYQPKFYYQRIPINTTNSAVGKIIHKESFIISPTAQSGFKLHPAFINEEGDELDYILLSAYEGCAYDVSESTYLTQDNSGIDFNNDKLSSIANVKPISGEHNELTIDKAEKLATNRGEGWHITTMESYSVDQMLLIVEYGTYNIQDAFEQGVSTLTNSYLYNRANNTGSTSSLGNTSGYAASSVNITNGSTNNYGENGKRSFSYRGEENPYGNIWKFIGNVNISGNGSQQGGVPYICKNYNYSNSITEDYESVGFCLPNNSDWTSGMGYGDEKYDWVFMPAEASNANSATPVGDSTWVIQNLNGVNYTAVGGNWLFQQKNGPFYYACDKDYTYYVPTFGARLVYIPRKNTIHNNNYALWQTKMGG